MTRHLRLGTRGSALALAQSRWVAGQLAALGWTVTLEVITTTGDTLTELPLSRIGTKGLFVSEIERALLEGAIDLAVHSMKDLPGTMPDGLTLGAVPEREDPRDVLVGPPGRPVTLAGLQAGAIIGTSSPRRRAQLLALRPDLGIVDLRGNLDTRLRKLDEGQFDAICLAAAGLHRLGRAERISEYLSPDVMMPAVGQGALAIQVRAGDARFVDALRPLHHAPTALAVRAERAVLAALGGGCAIPLGALARPDSPRQRIFGVLCHREGDLLIRDEVTGMDSPEALGTELARRLWDKGGQHLPGLTPPPERAA